MPPDPRDRVLTDLIARVRQIERRGRPAPVVAAKVIRPAGAVTNVTEENVTNVTNPSASVRNTGLTGWTEPGSPGQMPWIGNRADAGFSTASNGITVAESGWYRLQTFVAMEAESAVYAKVTFSLGGGHLLLRVGRNREAESLDPLGRILSQSQRPRAAEMARSS